MIVLNFKIINSLGLHVRACSKIVDCASKFSSSIIIFYNNNQADCKRIIDIMSVGAVYGAAVKIEVSGEDEIIAAEKIGDLFKSGFGEC